MTTIQGSTIAQVSINRGKTCHQCSKAAEVGKELLRCGGCRDAFYCNKVCQKQHWKVHKPNCQKSTEVQKTKAAVKDVLDVKDDGKKDQANLVFYPKESLPKEVIVDLKKAIAEGQIQVFKGPFKYVSPHDFGRHIKTLLISTNEIQGRGYARHSQYQVDLFKKQNEIDRKEGLGNDNFVKGIEALSQTLGFQVKKTTYPYYPRDHFLMLPQNCVATFLCDQVTKRGNDPVDTVLKADEICVSSALILKQTPMALTRHSFFFQPSTITVYHTRPLAVPEKDNLLKSDKPKVLCPFSMEGGNCLFATNKKGETICLLGKDAFDQVFMELILSDAFKAESTILSHLKGQISPWMKEASEKLKELYSGNFPALREIANEMYYRGLLPFRGKTALIEREKLLKVYSTYDDVLAGVIQKGLIRKPEFTDKECEDPKIIEYAAQRQILMEMILPYYFGVKHPVCIVPQCGYHLDTFLQSGPGGSLWFQSYSKVAENLKIIKNRSKELGLSSGENGILDRYIKNALKLEAELSPLYEKAKKRLIHVGFDVIPTPGLFYDDSPEFAPATVQKTVNFNFLNGISGYSQKAGVFYYITGGAKVGDKLGKVLMEMFREHLAFYVPNIQVHFVNGGMPLWNRICSQSGLHCMTSEWEVEAQKVSLYQSQEINS